MLGLRIAVLLTACVFLFQVSATTCDDSPKADEIVLNETVYYDYIGPEGGEYTHSERVICKEENVQPCEWRYDYSPSQESLEIEGCYVTHEGTKQDCNTPLKRRDVYEWSGTSTLAVSSPSCMSGDIYAIDLSRKYRSSGDDATCFYAGDYTNHFDYLRLEVEYPLDANVKYTSSRGTEPLIITNKTKRYVWEWRNLQPAPYDEFMPPAEEILDFVCITGHENFTSYNKYMRELFKKKLDAYQEVNETASEIMGNATGEEAIERTYKWVRDNIQYVPLEYGPLTNIEPHGPREIIGRGNGDCKDKSVLLTSLLRAQGFTAEPVLFGLDNDKLVTYFFDHVITKVSFGDKIVWVDPTCEYCPYGYLPKEEYGKYVMPFMASDELERLPDYDGADIYLSLDLRAAVDENGDASLSGVYEIGDPLIASVLRTSFKTAAESTAEDYLAKGLSGLCSDYSSLRFEPINPNEEQSNLLMNLSLECTGLFKMGNDATLTGQQTGGGLFGRENRSYDYYTGMTTLVKANLSLTFPDEYKIVTPGEEANISTPYYRFFGKRYVDQNRMVAYMETYMADRIPKDDYNNLINAHTGGGLLDVRAEKPTGIVATVNDGSRYLYPFILVFLVIASLMLALLHRGGKLNKAKRLKKMVDDLVKDGESEKNIKEVMGDAGYDAGEIESALAKAVKK